MYMFKFLATAWICFVQVALANPGVAFTKWPDTVYTEKPTNIYWASESNSPVTITLRKGESGNLQTMKVLTTQATGGAFTWTPDKSLPEGTDYALQIDQNGDINYSGLMTLAKEPGKEPKPAPSKQIPTASTSPLGGIGTGVAKGNNGHITLNPSSSRFNATSNKSTSEKFTGGASLNYLSLELALSIVAAIAVFAV
ncbi:hypothetical protein ARAM_000490 [Aspergillus rambellii]|uniref:Yeast cell wall synthesis Kre9/Knh1-like N-terminal domain-containing protein n=1 Tax=Aspergillus rambellii TaxID=308745 RepID=A0A0F8V268_9EURO|nr:hypothetical protein ARAM_000490 [Aspergillus rambellii]